MNHHELRDLMRRHSILQRDLATIAGRTERAVYDWMQGNRPIPLAVQIVLSALDDGRINIRWLSSKLPKA